MPPNTEIFTDSEHDENVGRKLDRFWIGCVIYSFSFALSTTTVVNYAICQVFQIIGMLIFLPAGMKLLRWKFDNFYLKFLFFVYCIWSVITILRGEAFGYEDVKNKLFTIDGIFRFFVPLIILFPLELSYYKKLFKIISILSLCFIAFDLMFYSNLMNLDYENNDTKFTFEHFVKVLSLPSGLVLLTFQYHSRKRIALAVITSAIGILVSIYRARRGLLFMTMSPVLFSFLFYLTRHKGRFIVILLSFLVACIFLVLMSSKTELINGGSFGFLGERVSEDTRTSVEECFFLDMSFTDWLIGKGIDGQYFCPNIDLNDVTGYRSMIETDFLNIILKGGILGLVVILLILVPAIVLGLFFSKNLLSKASAIWILLWVLALYPATVYSFSLYHITIWMSTAVCYSKKLRHMSESQVFAILSK